MPTIYKNGLVYGGSAGTASLIQATDVNGNTSNVQAELEKINVLDFNPAINHNNIYRGIMLVDTVEDTGRYTLTQLHNLVSAGDFSDIYVGDIIKVNMAAVTYTPAGGSSTTDAAQDVEWIVMGINTYLSCGNTELTSPHLVLVPKEMFAQKQHMNSTNTSQNGYMGSDMWLNILPAYQTAVSNCLGGYLLTYSSFLTDTIDTSISSSSYLGWTGSASHCTWVENTTLDLLKGVEVSGYASSSSIFDTQVPHSQLPGFRLNPSLIVKHNDAGDRSSWWLADVVQSTSFLFVHSTGRISGNSASSACGIVPKVLFG